MNRRGEVLIENVIFILLNLIFLSILVAFLLKQGSGAIIMEEAYAKQLALVVDSARPGEIIQVNMEDALKLTSESGFAFDKVLSFNNSEARVQLSSKGGYSYHYFNNVEASAFPLIENGEYTGMYTVTIISK